MLMHCTNDNTYEAAAQMNEERRDTFWWLRLRLHRPWNQHRRHRFCRHHHQTAGHWSLYCEGNRFRVAGVCLTILIDDGSIGLKIRSKLRRTFV